MDQISAPDETDIGKIPVSTEDFLEAAEHLTADDIKLIQSPEILSPLQIEWKMFHYRHGHTPFRNMNRLAECGILSGKFKQLKGQKFLCRSCIFGRMRKRAWRKKGKYKPIRKPSQNYAGAKVSIDQLVVAQPGLVSRMDGRHTNDRVCGAAGFFDHHTGYSYSALQTSLGGKQILAAKISFEAYAKSCAIDIRSYRADNGRFAEKSFVDAVNDCHQTIDFCVVSGHHQNGIIERHFQRLSSQARTVLLHAKRHWPAMITTVLWPFASKYSELVYNHLHVGEENGLLPAKRFSDAQVRIEIGDFHTWGCLCYALDSRAQNNNMVPKWEPRSRLGIYVGHSPCHAGSVALVLNPKSMHVSPLYHLVFDDEFTTVPFLASEEIPPNWAKLVAKSESVTTADYDLAQIWIQANEDPTKPALNQEGDQNSRTVSFDANETPPPSTSELYVRSNDLGSSEGENRNEPTNSEGDNAGQNKNINILLQPTLPELNELTCGKSPRTPKPSSKVHESTDRSVQSNNWSHNSNSSRQAKSFYHKGDMLY